MRREDKSSVCLDAFFANPRARRSQQLLFGAMIALALAAFGMRGTSAGWFSVAPKRRRPRAWGRANSRLAA
jgi:hypothetical protein